MRSQYLSQSQPQSQPQAITTRVILIRHGRSTFNELGLYQGSSDRSVLTEKGRAMAYQVGKYLQSERVDLVYTSPLQRVQQTTDAILQGMGIDRDRQSVQQHPNLREIDMHAWEGQTFKRVQESFAADYQCWKERPHEFQMEQSDSPAYSRNALATVARTQCFPVLDLFDRAHQFWQEIFSPTLSSTLSSTTPAKTLQHLDSLTGTRTIAIVSHGGTNRALINTALGITPSRFHRMQQSNCGISILNFPTGQLASGQLTVLNLTTPLGETLPKLKEGKQGLRLLLLPIDRTTPATVQPLSQLLSSIKIDFCLTYTSDTSDTSDTFNPSESIQTIAMQLLEHHRSTVQIQVQAQRDRSLATWQQIITANTNHPTQLMTGLVIASLGEIQQMLGEAIGLSSSQSEKLALQSGSLSILHYPSANQPPVLQAVNYQ